jgi:TonB family protein
MQPSALAPTVTRSIEPAAASDNSKVLSATTQQPQAPEDVQGQDASSSAPSSRRSNAVKLLRPLQNSPARIASSEPPQMPQTPGYGSTENLLGSGSLVGSRADAPAPPTSAATANSAAHASGQLDAPQLIYSPPLIYPSYARQANIEGVVVMDALVDGTGKVTDVSVVSGPIALQQAAMETVRGFKYQPARLDGRPVAHHMKVNLDFALNAPPASADSEIRAQPAPAIKNPSVVAPPNSAMSAAPKLISSPPLMYPAAARAENIEGTVVVDILVDASGKVTQAKAISGPVQLQSAAVEAVRYWKYQPARSDGQTVAQHMQVSINFRLN